MILKNIYWLQASKGNIVLGSHVWVEDPDICWVDGEVTKSNGEEFEIKISNGKKVKMTIVFSNVYLVCML